MKDRTPLADLLQQRGIPCEARSLPLGDFQWIARHRLDGSEYVLDCLLERKKVSDFCSSITSGRYAEQRSRLKTCGLTRLAYILEGSLTFSYFQRLPIPLSTVHSALAALDAVHGFFVFHSLSLDDSLDFIASLHAEVLAHYTPASAASSSAPVPLLSPSANPGEFEPYLAWCQRVKKSNDAVQSQQFGSQLRQIRGISAPIARALLLKYPTARSLYDALASQPNKDREVRLLAEIEVSKTADGKLRRIGPALARRIRMFFRALDYNQEEEEEQQPAARKGKGKAKERENDGGDDDIDGIGEEDSDGNGRNKKKATKPRKPAANKKQKVAERAQPRPQPAFPYDDDDGEAEFGAAFGQFPQPTVIPRANPVSSSSSAAWDWEPDAGLEAEFDDPTYDQDLELFS